MALQLMRPVAGLRTHISNNVKKVLCSASDQGFDKVLAASLTSLQGQKASRKKPFPYKTKDFRYWHLPLDRVDSRLDDNSKIIVIDGNLATGKAELGQKIAKEFDMHYVPDVSDTALYLKGELNVDIREFDDQLPVKVQSCDFERFYSQTGSKERLKNFSRTQYELFRYKVLNYAQNIIQHLLCTGQGVVMNRGMWSDLVFAHALRNTGHMSPAALKAYKNQYMYLTVDDFWHPHLIIYLDAPIDMVKNNIKKRNNRLDVNSPVINDAFLEAIQQAYKTEYLPKMSPFTEILTYDLADTPLDFEAVVEDLENLNLDKTPGDREKLFSDWRTLHNRDFNAMRSLCSKYNEYKIWQRFSFPKPYEAPELVVDGDDMNAYRSIVTNDPRIYYGAKDQQSNKARYFALM